MDVLLTVYQGTKGCIGATFSLEWGAIDSSLAKQKINSRSLTKAKLASIDKKIRKIA